MSLANLKFLVADDHPLYRQGIIITLVRNFSKCEVEEAPNGLEVLKSASKNTFDLIITDIDMPYVNGIQATKYIMGIKPESKVLAFSMHEDEAHIKELFSSGARGFVSKEANKDEMLNAVRSVLGGAIYRSAKKASTEKAHPQNETRTKSGPSISLREKEILLLICNGFTNREIAEKLFISTHTVENHRNHLLEKIGVHNTVGLVLFATKNGWI